MYRKGEAGFVSSPQYALLLKACLIIDDKKHKNGAEDRWATTAGLDCSILGP